MNKEDKSKLELIGEIAQANNKNLELIEEINDLQQKLDKILTYAKDRCEDYLKEDDCEYCDGVFASCRKVLQLAGEDISEYK